VEDVQLAYLLDLALGGGTAGIMLAFTRGCSSAVDD